VLRFSLDRVVLQNRFPKFCFEEITLDRRRFLQASGLSLGVGVMPNFISGLSTLANAQGVSGGARGAEFPKGFLWGSATASYQVEGAVHEGGRGPSIWDTFSHTRGKTANGDTGDVADDFYNRYPQDIAMMKEMGLKTFRFSVAWSRIFPSGKGQPNQAGLDFYNRMVDALLAAGIQPYCTLYHWDLPQGLEDAGGWQNRDTAKAFADYAGYTAGKLSDRVKHFMTMNEIRSFVELGYRVGIHAPGLKLDRKELAQLNHYVVLAHGMSVQAIRAAAKAGTKVGIADNVAATTPVIETAEHVAAAHKAMREENAMFMTVVQEGRYTDLYLKRLGADAPKFTAEELKIIGSPMDFVGLNIYTATYVRADDSEKGYEVVRAPDSYPHMYSSWLTIGPEALYWAPKLVADIWKVKEMYITENGASSEDRLAADGHVYDTDRVMYLRNYLTQLHRAIGEGIPVRGYFLWSLLDNYEWADGYEKRFGITYVDFKTQKRTPKLSAVFYKQVIAENRVV
jgi:beta-glucosidase